VGLRCGQPPSYAAAVSVVAHAQGRTGDIVPLSEDHAIHAWAAQVQHASGAYPARDVPRHRRVHKSPCPCPKGSLGEGVEGNVRGELWGLGFLCGYEGIFIREIAASPQSPQMALSAFLFGPRHR
jgi:hypothetical protein